MKHIACIWQGIQRCRRKTQSQNAYLYNALAVMAAELGRVEEARAWFEEGTRTLEGAASVALWQAWAVMEARQGDPSAVRYLFKKALGANPRSRWVQTLERCDGASMKLVCCSMFMEMIIATCDVCLCHDDSLLA